MKKRLIAGSVVLLLAAAACGSSRKVADNTTPNVTAAPAPAATTPNATVAPATLAPVTAPPVTEPPTPMFGDAPWPCRPAASGVTNKATEQGVTADKITIGYGDDAGATVSAGLNKELGDAIKAFAKKCNDLGGIAGRTINADYHDAKLFEVKQAITDACAKDFFLVGEGWAFDSQQEEIRVGCNLAAAPAYTVSAAFAHAKGVFQGVPNPADETPTMFLAQLAKLFPDKITKTAVLVGNYNATQETRDKVITVAPKFGYTIVKNLEYNISGESDWTPFVKQLKAAGAKLVYFGGSCTPNYLKFRQTAKTNGFDGPDVVFVADANFYTDACGAANADGAMDSTYVRMAFTPLFEASANKATQDYLDVVKGSGAVSQLGEQAASSFLLWATAASQCGANLTRQCVIDNMSKVTKWTGHGMHSETNPGKNHPPTCGLLVVYKGTGFERVVPNVPNTYDCDPAYGITPVTGVKALVPLKLDADRYSHQFDK